jgi:hypothetical protein
MGNCTSERKSLTTMIPPLPPIPEQNEEGEQPKPILLPPPLILIEDPTPDPFIQVTEIK